jgi:hypothetical protein
MKKSAIIVFFISALSIYGQAQNLPPVFGNEYENKSYSDSRIRTYLTPQRIVWQSDEGVIKNPGGLLEEGNNDQSELTDKQVCILQSTERKKRYSCRFRRLLL